MNNFYYALSLLNTLYGIDMDEDEFAEIALVGWRLIGNKRTKIYKYKVDVNECNQEVELPCNLVLLEAVTIGNLEEWAHSTNDTPNGDINSAYVESYIEHRKSFTHPLYIPGKFINYELSGNKLYFDKAYGTLFILYKGEVVDENDLPKITDKEARALATYCAWIYKYREGLKTNNTQIISIANTLQTLWLILCDLARVDRYLSQNEWDEVLDAKLSSNRKLYNKSSKIYQ